MLLQQLPFVVGATHVAGDYRFTDMNYLEEGIQKLLQLRVPSPFVHFMPGMEGTYPASGGTPWPTSISSLKQLAQTQPFQTLFNASFKVITMSALTYSVSTNIFPPNAIPDFESKEENEIYMLTRYLFNNYSGTGKIFILKNWETDWVGLGGYDPNADIAQPRVTALIKWFNARQRGVTRARNEAGGGNNVGVFLAAEVNRVKDAIDHNRVRMINAVIPNTNVDMVSYSAYDSMTGSRSSTLSNFNQTIPYIRSKLTDTMGLGNRRVFISEYGTPENNHSAEAARIRTQATLDAAQSNGTWGAYIWQLFDNECKDANGVELPATAYGNGDPLRPTNARCRGFYLIKPDGSFGAAYDVLRNYWN